MMKMKMIIRRVRKVKALPKRKKLPKRLKLLRRVARRNMVIAMMKNNLNKPLSSNQMMKMKMTIRRAKRVKLLLKRKKLPKR